MEGSQVFNQEELVEAVADIPADKPMQDVDATTSRKKHDQRQQLGKAMYNMLPVLAELAVATNTGGASMKWMPLVPDFAVFKEPKSIFDCRAPT
eukprot:11084740-Ditylum_brightwellii.AAC.1